MNLMPKLTGLGQVLHDPVQSKAWGGRARIVLGGLAEITFSILIAPIVAFGLSLFLIGMLFGRRVGWNAQQCCRVVLRWSEAAQVLWPQTLGGLLLGLWLWLWSAAPWALAFCTAILLPLVFAIPIAVLTTLPTVNV
ncbi:MAG: hypothetical protein QNI90_18885 [Dinoroseobacter sp.]|nr:hypothetical protein [Dinoroseobacter sp.]